MCGSTPHPPPPDVPRPTYYFLLYGFVLLAAGVYLLLTLRTVVPELRIAVAIFAVYLLVAGCAVLARRREAPYLFLLACLVGLGWAVSRLIVEGPIQPRLVGLAATFLALFGFPVLRGEIDHHEKEE